MNERTGAGDSCLGRREGQAGEARAAARQGPWRPALWGLSLLLALVVAPSAGAGPFMAHPVRAHDSGADHIWTAAHAPFDTVGAAEQARAPDTVLEGQALPATLSAAIDEALARRLAIRAAEHGIAQARAGRQQADSRLKPRLDLLAEYVNTRRWDSFTGISARYEVPGVGPTDIAVTGSTPRYQLLPRLALSYDLYAGGGEYAGQRQADRQLLAAEAARQAAVRQVVLDVVLHHLALRSACVQLDDADAALAVADDDLRRSELRHARGRQADIDWQQTRLDQLEKRQQREQQAVQVQLAWSQYRAAVRQAPTGIASETARHTLCRFDRDLAAELAMTDRFASGTPELERQQHDIAAAREQMRIERAATRPQLALFAQYGLAGRRNHDFGGLVGDTHRQQALIGLRLRLSLYDAGLTDARIAQARARMEQLQVQHARDSARLQQYREENRLHQQQARQTLALAQARLDLARQRLSLAQKRHRAGRLPDGGLRQLQLQQRLAASAVTQAEISLARLQAALRFGGPPGLR